MSNLTEIASAFKIVSNYFDPIRLKPNNDNHQRLNKVLVVTALSVILTRTGYGTFDNVAVTEAVYKTNNE